MKFFLFVLTWFFLEELTGQQNTRLSPKETRLAIASQMETSLRTGVLAKWYPQAVDSLHGGFLTTFTYDFKPTGPQDKFIVTKARHTWTTAKAAKDFQKETQLLACSRQGFQFLRDVMWDKTYGGFYSLVTRDGKVKSTTKEAYGNAFGIYALAAYYEASGDTAALNLAIKAFKWLEKNSHDPVHKGYFQNLEQDGSPSVRKTTTPSTSSLGYKDQNSSIHLLEAFTALYEVWKNDLLRERLEEMLLLIRDRITTPEGYLTLFLTPDWKPVSFRDSAEAVIRQHKSIDHVSFGHDVETAFLMLEASHVLGIKDDTKTMTIAKRMVDHALRNGWDSKVGGFFNEGYYFRDKPGITIIYDSKTWWAQAEALNTLLLMADKFPRDSTAYFEKFQQLWQYVRNYLIDHEHGDWYQEGLDKEPDKKTALKGHIWKGNYHQYRALTSCIKQLRQEK